MRLRNLTLDLAAGPKLVGVLNVTPDSFSDGGRFLDIDAAVAHAHQLVAEGADLLDIGGESTRPAGATYGAGAAPVGVDEELRRVVPVVERLVRELPGVPLSIDTMKPEVAEAALAAGAHLLNDVSGLVRAPELARIAARFGAPLVVMHGWSPTGGVPDYADLMADVLAFLGVAVAKARAAGVDQVIVDPGLGFGKTFGQNAQLVRRTAELHALGCPVLVGPSRKAFIGHLIGGAPPEARVFGTAAAVAAVVLAGAQFIRVHDVGPMRDVARVAHGIRTA